MCHNSLGGGSRNSYGQAYARNGYSFSAIENLDSDGDGFTNIQEINARTFPGDPNDAPAVATPTSTPTSAPTNTPVPPPTATDTPISPPPTATDTPVSPPPTATNTPVSPPPPPSQPSPTPTAQSPIPPGRIVRVKFDGLVEARPDGVGPVGRTGFWRIGGWTVLVDSATRIDEKRGMFDVGAWVKVHGLRNADGTVRAVHIKVERPAGNQGVAIEFKGVISSISGNTWVVNGQTVIVDSNTKIEGSPATGRIAKVKGVRRTDGTVLAKKIEIEGGEDDEDEGREVEFRDIIHSFNGSRWVVGSRTVLIDANTRIEGTPAVGALAEVKAILRPDGSLLARKIEVKPVERPDTTRILKVAPTPKPTAVPKPTSTPRPTPTPQLRENPRSPAIVGTQQVEFEGQIRSLRARSWVIGERTVTVDGSTRIVGRPQVGLMVKVKAVRQSDNTWRALSIEVEVGGASARGQVDSRQPAGGEENERRSEPPKRR